MVQDSCCFAGFPLHHLACMPGTFRLSLVVCLSPFMGAHTAGSKGKLCTSRYTRDTRCRVASKLSAFIAYFSLPSRTHASEHSWVGVCIECKGTVRSQAPLLYSTVLWRRWAVLVPRLDGMTIARTDYFRSQQLPLEFSSDECLTTPST